MIGDDVPPLTFDATDDLFAIPAKAASRRAAARAPKDTPANADLKQRGRVVAADMKKWSESLRAEGRTMFANALKDAAEVVRQLSL